MSHSSSSPKNSSKRTEIIRKRTVREEDLKLTIALTDYSRRRIIELLNKNTQGMTAKELAKELGLKIPTVMSHLKILRESGAIRSEKRTGTRVRRPLNHYFSIVEIRTAKQIERMVKKATDAFGDYLIDATTEFMIDNKRLIPRTSNPYYLAKWLDTLISKVSYKVPYNVIFINNDVLAEHNRFRDLGVVAARSMLFNDFMFLLNGYTIDLYESDPELVNKLARDLGQSEIKSEEQILLVVEAMNFLLSGSDAETTKAKRVLVKLIRSLPRNRRSKILQFWPLVLKSRELSDHIKDQLLSFFFFGDENEVLARCEANAELIKKFRG